MALHDRSLPIMLSALAYLDPGSGSVLLQLALGAILGIGIFVRLQWARIKKLFGGKSEPPGKPRDPDRSE